MNEPNPNVPPSTFLPALRFQFLTPTFDVVVRLAARDKKVKALLLAQADLAAATAVLDVGSGTGTLCIEAKRQYPHLHVVGVDADRRIVELARAKARAAGVKIDFLVAGATKLPLQSGTFDRVVSSLTYHHLAPAAKSQASAEAARVLRNAGELHLR